MAWAKHKADKADTYFSLWVRNRDDFTCQRCGKRYEPPTSAIHCAHFIGRGKENTRFDPDNCISLCFHDHQYFHGHPMEFIDWFTDRFGENLVNDLRLRGVGYKKKDRKLEEMYWKTKLKEDFGI